MERPDLTGVIVTAAMRVHSTLGPGLLERAYQMCLAHELRKRGRRVRSEVPLPLLYDGVEIDLAYRLDLLVDEAVVVECKTVAKLAPIHTAQLLSHLRLSGCRFGLLLNFHEHRLKNGIVRLINSR
jgi:GxxExxY protein